MPAIGKRERKKTKLNAKRKRQKKKEAIKGLREKEKKQTLMEMYL